MTGISHLLEEFDRQNQTGAAHAETDDAFEESRLAAFENGYQAGWDDASAAHSAEQAHISSDFSQNLQALNFTYQEAYHHVLGMLKPVLTQLVEIVLPSVAQETLGIRIIHEVMEIAKSHSSQKVNLIMSPESRTKLEKIIPADKPTLIQFVDDGSLSDGQIFIKFEKNERKIDLDNLLSRVNSLIHEFIVDFERRNQNG